MNKTRIIAFANQKGGVGKTMSVLSIGAGIAAKGESVLVIDADAQANLTMSLGFDPDELELTISQLLASAIESKGKKLPENIEQYVLSTNIKNLDLIASDMTLSGIETLIQTMPYGRENLFKQIVDSVKEKYDFILIDCPPSLGIITINALIAATEVLIPTQAQIFSYKGSELLIQNIDDIRVLNPSLKYAGILITMVNPRSKDAQAVILETQDAYGEHIRIFKNFIPQSVRASESNRMRQSIFEYDQDGKIAEAYRACVEELLND